MCVISRIRPLGSHERGVPANKDQSTLSMRRRSRWRSQLCLPFFCMQPIFYPSRTLPVYDLTSHLRQLASQKPPWRIPGQRHSRSRNPQLETIPLTLSPSSLSLLVVPQRTFRRLTRSTMSWDIQQRTTYRRALPSLRRRSGVSRRVLMARARWVCCSRTSYLLCQL